MAFIKCCFEVDASEVFESVVRKCTNPGCKLKRLIKILYKKKKTII